MKSRGGTPSANDIKFDNDIIRVPEQAMARVGSNFTFNKLTLSAGVRYELLPASDLIGGDADGEDLV